MVDNFELIKNYISAVTEFIKESFENDDDKYYTVEIIKRKKDHPEMHGDQRIIKIYYINSTDKLYENKDEIITLCNVFKARAYISVNYKSYKKVMLATLTEYANRAMNEDYKKPYSIYQSCSGKYVDSENKLWLIDVDKEDIENLSFTEDEIVTKLVEITDKWSNPDKHFSYTIPTCSGIHIIVLPFNLYASNQNNYDFRNLLDEDKVKKNAQTILYAP